MPEPVVTVLMPAFNAQDHIEEAIKSILEQSFSDFELIVVNDGSTDTTEAKVRQFLDERIVLINNLNNKGLVAALNEGLSIARGRFIARMDADDISCLDRLRQQVELMSSNPQVVLCGTWGETFGTGPSTRMRPETESRLIRAAMLLDNSFIHSSVMMRKAILQDNQLEYRKVPAEDYDLWQRLADLGEVRNIPQILVRYRLHQGQITERSKDAISLSAMHVRYRQLENLLGRALEKEEADSFESLLSSGGSGEAALGAVVLVMILLRANKASGYCDQNALKEVLFRRLRRLLKSATRPPLRTYADFCFSHIHALTKNWGVMTSLRILQMIMRGAGRLK